MPDTDDAALWHALNRLLAAYWAEVDHNAGQRAHGFYLPDALYTVGVNEFEGAGKIRAFYERRRQIGHASTRHLIHNLRVQREDAAHARATGIVSLYGAAARPPVHESRPFSMIADFEARFELGEEGWRFRSHALQPVFVGENAPASILIDPRRL